MHFLFKHAIVFNDLQYIDIVREEKVFPTNDNQAKNKNKLPILP